jgi:predicted DsbA family dithiol-disulfide isomerase
LSLPTNSMFVVRGAKAAGNLVEETGTAIGSGLLSTFSGKRRSGKVSTKPLPVVRLEIVSDTVCPFCYLLFSRLPAVFKQFEGKLEFEVHWIAYQLQPLAPPEGVPKAVFMEQKFKGQAQYLMEKKQAFFESQGLTYTADGIIGNTFNSHRLVVYAGKQSLAKQWEVMGLLFKAFFVDAKHINDAQVLREIAREAKLRDPDRVADDPTCCAEEVRLELETKYKDVIGVPHTVINAGQIRLGGAQDAKVFTRVFQQLLEESRLEGKS